jgi:hypothetical protein
LVVFFDVGGAFLERGVGLFGLPVVVEELAQINGGDTPLRPGGIAQQGNQQQRRKGLF